MTSAKPRVAIVTNIAWNIYNFRRGLATAIREAGYEPVLMAAPDPYAEKLIEEGWIFIPVNNLERTGINPLKDLRLLNEFIKLYKGNKIACALHYNAKPLVYASLAASYLGIPYIPSITGLAGPFSGDRPLIGKIVTILYTSALKHSYRVVFQNNEDRAFFLEKKITVAPKTLLIEGSGVNMEKFRSELYGEPPADHLVFLMFARLSRAKGVEYFIDSARFIKKKHPNIVFKLAGPFDSDKLALTKEEIDAWVKEGIIEYLGVSDFIQKEISQAHVIVYPSYYREGIPKSLIESAAMSRPIITTDNVGCREVVKDGVNGFLVPVKSGVALTAACERFIALSAEEKIAMGKASRELAAERFDEKKVVGAYVRLIGDCLN
ncbi:MAG: glycosyltransferase family 4 protein [Mucilaginibacter sp.]